MSTGFPPLKGNKPVSPQTANLPGNDTGNPTSTGNGGIPAALKVKKAGTKDAPGLEKSVNKF